MKSTSRKATNVKPQSKKKIGKPLSKFTKVQSTSTLSKLEDTGKNFYEAGKEVANKGTDLLKQISAVPEKGLSEVVKMAIKAEQDAAYGRKVVMILGMILSTLMFLFTRLGQDYDFDEKYDPKISLPSGYGIVSGDANISQNAVDEINKVIGVVTISDLQFKKSIKMQNLAGTVEIKTNLNGGLNYFEDIIKILKEKHGFTFEKGTRMGGIGLSNYFGYKVVDDMIVGLQLHTYNLNTSEKFVFWLPGEKVPQDMSNLVNEQFALEKYIKGLEEYKTVINPMPSKYGLKTTKHSVWSVAASALALTLLGRAAFMNKKEQFYYFVDFIIAFLVCSVVYFILVGIFGKKEDNDAFITNASFFDKKDAATGYAVETYNAAYNGIASALFKSKKAVSDTDDTPKVVQDPIVTSVQDPIVPSVQDPPTLLGGKKRSKRRNKVTRGGMSTGISTQSVLVALTGVLAAIVLTSEKRRNFFSARLNKMIQYIKNNVSSKKEIV